MNAHDLQGKHVLVLGLGLSGLAMARWCARHGARITVADTRGEPPQLATLREELPDAKFVAGEFQAHLLDDGVQAVMRSPGLSPEQIAHVTASADELGIPVGGELSLFASALAALKADKAYSPAVLAVTGTNGKTTVTALAGQLVERSGRSVAVAGNIGPTLLDTLAQKIDADALPQVWVIELSSFQLETPGEFEPTAATVLNITQDHLDWHGSMKAYAAAKQRVFGKSTLMILNREDAMVMAMLPEPVRVSAARPPAGAKAPSEGSAVHAVASVGARNRGKFEQREYITFGADSPQRAGDFGIEETSGMAWLVRAHEADETRRKRSEEAEEIFVQRLMPCDALRIRGRHNAVNALAALALASAAGCALGPMLYGLREYRGEPHRVESVGIVGEVEYFDDSKGTNVGATVAALQGLGAERKLVVILGGDGKGQDFSPLAAPVVRHARAAVLIGRDAPLLREVLEPQGVRLIDAASMEEAVTKAAQVAHPGDAVLMSPACASFDMFRNYPHRAEVFRAAVRTLADAAGVELEGAA
ncbi:UDP-N-acetylmuramoyl-L-alanine--D-glutamate ligase [Caenimonas koreensis DSM 17982]|uniref:UDP-N-acetylmuramoylalanine--D-glutamate ligase n=1 Tax=Caenimonas koreensis DSM 17982 TaxID=1121255 RepID=A0A844B7G7_9BURK|nr:UDP-N-acetylmuramoyl-L-alanine--D-glutamate ligase [Caenimonas koreensis]MRD47589.1 UDP-N-acetylmuramoyl-L-alanine--D-glutamate ligase [Caenimonas koreensis DSM 17982]